MYSCIFSNTKICLIFQGKHGRNINLISQKLSTKTTIEIKTLIDAEYGISSDTPSGTHDDSDNIPYVEKEEIVSHEVDNICDVITMVTTGAPTVAFPKLFRAESNSPDKSKNPTHKNYIFNHNNHNLKTIRKEKIRAIKKNGNHRRKVSRNFDKNIIRNKSKDMKSPGRWRKESTQSEDSMKSSTLQIVLGSGQALRVSEGEQVV